MNIQTAWVNPSLQIKGQDPLAVRAPCENIYSQLLPGITNVTDRAYLYAFYPWLIWSFEQHYGQLRNRPFFHTLRRAECLLTLISAWHERKTEENSWLHGAGLVGRDTLLPALRNLEEGKSLKLSTFSALDDDPHRYFKNKLGGLGQYYLGTLRDLAILEGNARTEVKYIKERGGALAKSFDSKVDRLRFFEVLELDRVDIETFKELRRYCPCYLVSNKSAHSDLVSLLLNRSGIFQDAYSDNRRHSFALMLDLASRLRNVQHEASPNGFDVDVFRACTYAGALPSGDLWKPPPSLQHVCDGWHTYHKNELLSIAVQTVFWVGLAELGRQGLMLKSSEEYQRWFRETFNSDSLAMDLNETFGDAVERSRHTVPVIETWTDESHEVQLGWDLVSGEYDNGTETSHSDALVKSLTLFLTLAAREQKVGSAYEGYIESRNYLSYYPINLDSFRQRSEDSWQQLTLSELLGWLAKEWGVSAHFQVALRKLRYEARDTFRIKPTEQGLEVIDAPFPGFSNPRLSQAIQILRDLGALEFDEDTDRWQITEQGTSYLKECSGD